MLKIMSKYNLSEKSLAEVLSECQEMAMQAIGMNNRKPYTRHGKKYYKPYRNRYQTDIKDLHWNLLVDLGYAKKEVIPNRVDKKKESWQEKKSLCWYWMTRKGLDWLQKRLNMTIYDEED